MATDESDSEVLTIYPPRVPNGTEPIIPYPSPQPGIPYVGLRQAAFDRIVTLDATRQNAALLIADPIPPPPYESLRLFVNGEQIGSWVIPPSAQNDPVELDLPQAELNEGLNIIRLRYQRGSSNFDDSQELGVQYHRNLPGGNEVPGTGDHPALNIRLPAELGDPALIGYEELTNGVPLTLQYPFCRAYDRIKLEINNVPFYYTVQPGQEGQPYTVLLTMEMYLNLQKPSTLSINYTVTDTLLNTTDRRRWSKKILAEVDPVDGQLLVMGARVASVSYWMNKGSSRYVTALDAQTGGLLRARWRYEGDAVETVGARFDDTQPRRPLLVRHGARQFRLNPANFYGNGLCDLTAPGTPHSAFVALRDRGDMIAWGISSNGGHLPPAPIPPGTITDVAWTSRAFAVLLNDGSVRAWGDPAVGGALPTEVASLRDVNKLFSGGQAFALLRNDGSVLAWGAKDYGAVVPADISRLKDIRDIACSGSAFAALRSTGGVSAWGNPAYGGSVPADIAGLTTITEVINNHDAFAALTLDRTVVTWGLAGSGGTAPAEITRLTDIVRISSCGFAFAALRATGQVVAWGRTGWGGNPPAAILNLSNIVDIVGAGHAFAALLDNQQVVAWGDPAQGGSVPPAISALRNIVQLAATNGAFAALCADGSVVTWGNAAWGGNNALVARQLVDVRAIYANAEAFVALTADDRVVTWGLAGSGGNSEPVRDEFFREVSYLAPVSQGVASNAIVEAGTEQT